MNALTLGKDADSPGRLYVSCDGFPISMLVHPYLGLLQVPTVATYDHRDFPTADLCMVMRGTLASMPLLLPQGVQTAINSAVSVDTFVIVGDIAHMARPGLDSQLLCARLGLPLCLTRGRR